MRICAVKAYEYKNIAPLALNAYMSTFSSNSNKDVINNIKSI